MSQKPKVSIVTIAYNHEKYIAQAIESFLMQQADFPIEIIIADDCSTDRTPQIIEGYAKKHPGIIRPIYRKKNIGAIANSIEALKAARGKYIALCEGDDYWTDPFKLQKQIDFLDKNPSYALSFHLVKVAYEDKPYKNFIWPWNIDKENITVDQELKENFIPTNSVVFRRQKYDSLPRNIMPLDWYLHLFNAQYGKIGFIDEVMSVYRKHGDGLWWANETNKALLWQKYGLSMLSLHTELLKLYGKKNSHKEIIYGSIKGVFNELVEVDHKKKSTLVGEAVTMFPEVAARLLTEQYLETKKQREEIERKASQIEELNAEVVSARNYAYQLRDQLHSLTHARLLGRIIKFRGFIGNTRQKIGVKNIFSILHLLHRIRLTITPHIPAPARQLIKRFLRQVVVVGAPFVPGRVRRPLKRLYNEIMHRQAYTPKPAEIHYATLDSEPWPKDLPLVSVVVPYYNRADTIDETINSLKEQSFTNFETIIVDDASTDQASIEKLKALETGDLKLRLIYQPSNRGVAAARNSGIEKARGKYIVCLDSDDILEHTFIEKCTLVLETDPDVALVTTDMDIFGVMNEAHKNINYNPKELFSNNMVITAAMFRKEAWEVSGGYKSEIGYEDWEFWINLAEHGFWGKRIPETIFKYRTSMKSRYVEDKDIHWSTLKTLRQLHPGYKKIVSKMLESRHLVRRVFQPETALLNLRRSEEYLPLGGDHENVLVTIPWMTFGGAETLIYNYCREVKDKFNISFVTGLKSENEWEYKFKEISQDIYHLANLFDDPHLYLEFISNYITTRKISILHIIHNGFTFEMLPELKKRHPKLNVCLSMFNDRVEYFEQSIKFEDYIDIFVTDNNSVANHYRSKLKPGADVVVIPNGINCYDEFSPGLYDRDSERKQLDLTEEDLGVFFIGRLSEEKNPDVFLRVARDVLSEGGSKAKFFVIGDGPMRAQVERTIKAINSPRVTYLGYQSEVARYLSAADIFVLPSSIEGFPLSILEAMAMRVAVIASDVGAVADVIDSGETGLVVAPGSIDEIKTALSKLAADNGYLESMKSNARYQVEKVYSNRTLGANYKKLYGRLIK